jgi:RNA polymerase sigma-70 factor (ECF subfamily)
VRHAQLSGPGPDRLPDGAPDARPNGPARAREPRAELVEMIPALRAFARSFCRNVTDADDLVQETLLKGIANIHRYQPDTNMKSWLFTIMRNTFYTRIKVYNRESPAAGDCASAEPATQALQEWRLRGKELTRAVRELPDKQREVLILISVLGMSYLDAAEICGCAVGTVKSRLNRARQRLVERFGEDPAQGPGAGPMEAGTVPPATS